jgi:hypothetical protein
VNELCSNSSCSLSANKASSQLIFGLEQARTSRLLSSSLHDWKNLWFTKPGGSAEGHNLSLDCPSFGASWGSDSPSLLGVTNSHFPDTLINVAVSGLVLSSSLERVPRRIIHPLHACFLPSIDGDEKEHGMSKRHRKLFSVSQIGFSSCGSDSRHVDQTLVMKIGLSSCGSDSRHVDQTLVMKIGHQRA